MVIEQDDWKKVLAEIVGTFFFFFIGIGAALVSGASAGAISNFYVAIAHGVALAIAISALGHISGAHFNPAVTISLMVTSKISPVLAAMYILGQIIGGILACLALLVILPGNAAQTGNFGTPGLAEGMGIGPGLLLEAILTFFLVLAVFGTVVDPRPNRIAGFGIGLTVFVDILVGGPLTGGVMNPARAFTPAVVSGAWRSDQWVYWVGPIIGGVVAALLYTTVFLPREDDKRVAVPTDADQPSNPPVSEPGLLKDR